MEYGPHTKELLGVIGSGDLFRRASAWSPDQFALPFPERLVAVVEDFYDLPSAPNARAAALKRILTEGAGRHGFTFSRTTLTEWLEGGRDPSVSSSDRQTRENIYRLCAALEFDLELSVELFEKVFFSRAFNPKDQKELCLFFHARKDFDAGIGDGSWYEKGQALYGLVSGSREDDGSPPIKETSFLINEAEYLSEQEFIRFVVRHHATFQPENRNEAARAKIRDYAVRCCNAVGRFGTVTELKQIPWDSLINEIIGYTQRSSSGIIGSVSNVSSLPDQLTTNFPTGQTLRRICSGDESSFDKMYKMLCLLLFYCYFSQAGGRNSVDTDFRSFLMFANHELQAAAFPELYPGQPYAGMLLFCAAHSDPVETLRGFLRDSIERESENVLIRTLSEKLPSAGRDLLTRLVRCAGHDPFTVQLMASTLQNREYGIRPEELSEELSEEEEDRSFAAEQTRQTLLELVSSSGSRRRALRYASLLPPEGLPEELFQALFPDTVLKTAETLAAEGWLTREKGLWREDYRVRELVADQEWFPRAENCREPLARFLSAASAISLKAPSDSAALAAYARRLSSLDGLPPAKREEILALAAEKLLPLDPKLSERLRSGKRRSQVALPAN